MVEGLHADSAALARTADAIAVEFCERFPHARADACEVLATESDAAARELLGERDADDTRAASPPPPATARGA